MASLRQRPWWPGAVSGAVALAVAASIGPALNDGGLAPLAVAALVAGTCWRAHCPGGMATQTPH